MIYQGTLEFNILCAKSNLYFFPGRPRPWVKWFRDEVETDTPATPLSGNGVRGVLRVGPLTRLDVRAAFTCRASNHARAHPIETTLTLDMNCKF